MSENKNEIVVEAYAQGKEQVEAIKHGNFDIVLDEISAGNVVSRFKIIIAMPAKIGGTTK